MADVSASEVECFCDPKQDKNNLIKGSKNSYKDEKGEIVHLNDWLWYFRPEQITKIMGKKYLRMALLTLFAYAVQFTMAVACCNFYSDVTRKDPCVDENVQITDPDEASAVFDGALKACGIYHIAQWLRCCLLLVAILLGEQRMMNIWYATVIPVFILGLVAFIMAHVKFFSSEEGFACAESQETRRQWLFFECLYSWTLFFWL